MKQKLKCVMLIDDDPDDNFFHEKAIKECDSDITVLTMNSAIEALEFLKSNKNKFERPDLVFLDINMPCMNGWDFLNEYTKLEKEVTNTLVIIMLSTSENPDDIAKAKGWNCVIDYISKPLTKEVMDVIIDKYFCRK